MLSSSSTFSPPMRGLPDSPVGVAQSPGMGAGTLDPKPDLKSTANANVGDSTAAHWDDRDKCDRNVDSNQTNSDSNKMPKQTMNALQLPPATATSKNSEGEMASAAPPATTPAAAHRRSRFGLDAEDLSRHIQHDGYLLVKLDATLNQARIAFNPVTFAMRRLCMRRAYLGRIADCNTIKALVRRKVQSDRDVREIRAQIYNIVAPVIEGVVRHRDRLLYSERVVEFRQREAARGATEDIVGVTVTGPCGETAWERTVRIQRETKAKGETQLLVLSKLVEKIQRQEESLNAKDKELELMREAQRRAQRLRAMATMASNAKSAGFVDPHNSAQGGERKTTVLSHPLVGDNNNNNDNSNASIGTDIVPPRPKSPSPAVIFGCDVLSPTIRPRHEVHGGWIDTQNNDQLHSENATVDDNEDDAARPSGAGVGALSTSTSATSPQKVQSDVAAVGSSVAGIARAGGMAALARKLNSEKDEMVVKVNVRGDTPQALQANIRKILKTALEKNLWLQKVTMGQNNTAVVALGAPSSSVYLPMARRLQSVVRRQHDRTMHGELLITIGWLKEMQGMARRQRAVRRYLRLRYAFRAVQCLQGTLRRFLMTETFHSLLRNERHCISLQAVMRRPKPRKRYAEMLYMVRVLGGSDSNLGTSLSGLLGR